MNFDKWRHYVRARMFEIVRRPEGAIAEFKLALELDPRFRKAANALGYRYAQLGRHRDAAGCFERVVSLNVADAVAHYNLGFSYDQAGEARKAIEGFRSAVALNSRFDLAWYGMGLAHAALGEHREAMGAFDKAARLQPMSAPVWYQLGMACHHARELGRLHEIIHHVNRFDPRMARRLIQETGSSDLAYLVKDLLV
jgi:tetratricopeptide (TPR) repeat protein